MKHSKPLKSGVLFQVFLWPQITKPQWSDTNLHIQHGMTTLNFNLCQHVNQSLSQFIFLCAISLRGFQLVLKIPIFEQRSCTSYSFVLILASVGYISEVKVPKFPVMNISHMIHAKFSLRQNRHCTRYVHIIAGFQRRRIARRSLLRPSSIEEEKSPSDGIEPATLRSIFDPSDASGLHFSGISGALVLVGGW